MSPHLQRALLLIEQSRWELADQSLRQELTANPDSAMAHALLALCLLERDRHREATDEAQRAVHQEPDLPFAHYCLARVHLDCNRTDEAQASLEETLRLDPDQVNAWGLLATIYLQKKRWPQMLETAERGLAIEPDDERCNNLRAMALFNLGRRDEAGATIDSTLSKHPESAFAHANMGWTSLQLRQPNEAMEHFRQALRLDPEMEWARAGIVEALKAKNFLYRWMLQYFFFMMRLDNRVQWGIVVGGYVLYRVLYSWKNQHPEWAPFVWPVLGLYLAFVVLTWIANPLFNLLLRCSRYGRLALDRKQIVESNWLAGFLLAALMLFGVAVLLSSELFAVAALFVGVLVLPLSAVFNCESGWPRWAMILVVCVLLALALSVCALPLAVLLGVPRAQISAGIDASIQLFAWGMVGALVLGNALPGISPKK